MPAARIDPPQVGDERTMLVAWLDYGRATLLAKCEGLSREALVERSVPPSDLTLLGLVRHRTEGEHYWFSRVIGREDAPPLYYYDVDPDGDFHPPADVDAEADLAAFRTECDRSRALVAAQPSLEVTGKGPGGPVSLRWILLHMTEEYARHNGHADLLRERIDGATGE